MSDDRSLAVRRAAIDERVEAALAPTQRDRMTPARRAVRRDDRWCGQLLALAHGAAAPRDDASVLPAAGAVELLRGYYRLREEMLLRHAGEPVGPEATAGLLGSDYLFASAYSALGSVENERVTDCFDVLITVSETIIEGFGERYLRPTGPAVEYSEFVDRTAGALGRGTALLGAMLADTDEQHRERFGRVGRGIGAIKRIQATMDGSVTDPHAPDERELERRVRSRRDELEDALRELGAAFDVSGLRAFVEITTAEGDAVDASKR